MSFYYRVFGLICESEIEIPVFFSIDYPNEEMVDFFVKIGEVKKEFKSPLLVDRQNVSFNVEEFYYKAPNTANYFVRNGNEITIDAISSDWSAILLYFYSNCVAAVLYQRNLIPFHVSGVLDKDGDAWLFSGPSKSGKSTIAIKLHEKGYKLFTDDSALIYVSGDSCYAVSSYPMIRAWEQTVKNQGIYSDNDTVQILSGIPKFGILFHEDFIFEPVRLKGIVFLQLGGDSIQVNPMTPRDAMVQLGENVYRKKWIPEMKKQVLQFNHVAEIAKRTLFWGAVRPYDHQSFEEFSDTVINKIIELSRD
jgi:hypothetical protein